MLRKQASPTVLTNPPHKLDLYAYPYDYWFKLARTIAISDDVYDLLKKSKLPNESFSAVIRRNLRKGKLVEIAGSGTISKGDWERAKKHLVSSESRSLKKLTETL
jgi:predicted CopG family antitoxin